MSTPVTTPVDVEFKVDAGHGIRTRRADGEQYAADLRVAEAESAFRRLDGGGADRHPGRGEGWGIRFDAAQFVMPWGEPSRRIRWLP
ncbi:MAG: hypothetical protein ACOH1U_05535 [Rhodoglobus sp.]